MFGILYMSCGSRSPKLERGTQFHPRGKNVFRHWAVINGLPYILVARAINCTGRRVQKPSLA